LTEGPFHDPDAPPLLTEEKVQVLRARSAPWYYVIAADTFDAIRLQRRDLVQRRVSALTG